MTDPWVNVRASAALEAIEKSRNHDGSSVITITAMEFLVIKDDARIIEADANALLAVKEAAGELSLAMRVIEDWKADAITRRVKRLADALAALPEYLK